MYLQSLSHNVLCLILEFLTYNELQEILFTSQGLFIHISIFIYRKQDTLHLLNYQFIDKYIHKFSNLQSVSLYVRSDSKKQFNQLCQKLPNTITKLALMIDLKLSLKKQFYDSICKYHKQLIYLELGIIGQQSEHMKQQQEDLITIPYFHNFIYQKLNKLKKIVVDVHNVKSEQEIIVQNIIFYSLFYKDELNNFQPNVTHIHFNNISHNNQFKYLNNQNFQKNTNIQSVTLKMNEGMNYLLDLLHQQYFFTNYFGQQVTKLSLTQNTEDWTDIQGEDIRYLLQYFNKLTKLQLNVYNQSYYIRDFQIDQIPKLVQLNKLGLSSLENEKSHFASLLSQMNLIKINLDFTHLNDDGLQILEYYPNIQQLHLRGVNHLSSDSIYQFIQKQRNLKRLDIRGITSFGKKSFRSLIQNNKLTQLSISKNKMNNQVLIQLLYTQRHTLCSINIGELSHNSNLTDDVFEEADTKYNIKLLNVKCLQIHFSQKGFKNYVLPYVLKIFPNISILSLKVIFNHHLFNIFEYLSVSKQVNKLEKLIISQYGFQSNISKNDKLINIFQNFRNKMNYLHTIVINSTSLDEQLRNIFLETKGNKLRIINSYQQYQI